MTLNREVLGNLGEIVTQVHKVREVMGEIAATSEQQQGVQQLNTAVKQLNQVTQQTAANSEEAASTAEELSSQAVRLGARTLRGHGHPTPVMPEEVIPFDDNDAKVLRDF